MLLLFECFGEHVAVNAFRIIVKLGVEMGDIYRSDSGNKGGGWSVVLSNENGSFD
jgi:hypothetical protein